MRLEDCCHSCDHCGLPVCLDADRDALNADGEAVCDICRRGGAA